MTGGPRRHVVGSSEFALPAEPLYSRGTVKVEVRCWWPEDTDPIEIQAAIQRAADKAKRRAVDIITGKRK